MPSAALTEKFVLNSLLAQKFGLPIRQNRDQIGTAMPTIFPDPSSNGNSGNNNNQANSINDNSTGSSTTRDRLLKKFSTDGELLSLGVTIARVVELASSDDEGTQNLANYILSDVALTQKILRLANTVFYRNVSNTPVSTVTRAIFLLGFNTVKTTALALLLIDKLSKNQHTNHIRRELIESLCASLIGRELARYSHLQGVEEAAIAALFKNLGKILLVSHEYPLYRDITNLLEDGVSPTQAEIQTMGCSYDFLTEAVLREWNLPDTLIYAMSPLGYGPVKPARNRPEWMRQVVVFSGEAQRLILQNHDKGSSKEANALLQRFGQALHLDTDRIRHLFTAIGQEIGEVAKGLDLHRTDCQPQPATAPVNQLPIVLQAATINQSGKPTDARHPSGKPVNARDLLLAGIGAATQLMATTQYKPSELILLIVETLHSSLGFRFSAACIHDMKSGQFRAAITMGEQHSARQPRFCFPATPGPDVFHLALENRADLMIADASTPKIRDLLPGWHRSLLTDARSIMILPLFNESTPVGLFYGDRVRPAPEGIPSDEAGLIKTLMGQMQTAIRLRQRGD